MTAEDATLEAAAERRLRDAAPASKKRSKARGYRSSDDEDESSEEEEEDSSMDEDEEDGAAAAPQRAGGAAAAGGLEDAVADAARTLIAHRRRTAESLAEFESLLALAALKHKCQVIAARNIYEASDAYKTFLETLAALAPDISGAAGAQSPASVAAAAAAAAIVADVADRARRFDGALDDGLNELVNEWTMSRARMAELLGMPAAKTVPFERLKINDTLCAGSHACLRCSQLHSAC